MLLLYPKPVKTFKRSKLPFHCLLQLNVHSMIVAGFKLWMGLS